ncbi:Fe-S cluster assembly protein SufD [Lactobacillus delbrueckii]|uniref:Fe-S cluster assembly protein SufD n=1 Tax=Lactobacillus delbrueckii TaxID=1584 RepID=UPI0006819763|nr:Fe-S cluster assembly protein SufD [Lactobacillus delbrueckii]APP03467.1 Fe-S cluster assembly protein SufD [Lactobacillus delbrueckii subsp. indicus]KNE30124.1 Fe-S cluster assembly protein SufD [Lactobacillus delbrueckii subsp. indicus]KRL76802.1 Fe-S cluster assembly ABC-type transport system, permease [Lactobacillus delbrueckii subsp. indicus DSM 15996]
MTAQAWFAKMQAEAAATLPDLPRPDFAKVDYRAWPLSLTRPLQKRVAFSIEAGAEFWTKGCVACDWETALAEHGDLLEKYFGRAANFKENRLLGENVAKMEQGLFIYVPDNVALAEPLTVTYLQDSQKQEDFALHVLLVAGKNAAFSYFEKVASRGDKEATANLVVEICALAGSRVKYAAIDRLGKNTTAYLKRVAWVGRDAKVDWAMGMLSDGKILADYDSDLYGQGARAEMNVIAITIGDQVQGLNTVVNNYGKKSDGRILQHGVILQKSCLVFNGIGHVMKGAKGANAQQENRVLMLSRSARGDANPILLIDDNDVFAGHAASVGRVDDQQLYYLMSRGLPKPLAERLVIRGFLGPVLTKIPEASRQPLFEMVERKLIDGQELE